MIDHSLIGKQVYDTTQTARRATIKAILPDGRMIVTDQWKHYIVIALGDVWQLVDKQTKEEPS